jgi:hypothetical protein
MRSPLWRVLLIQKQANAGLMVISRNQPVHAAVSLTMMIALLCVQRLTLLGRLPCNDVVADHPSLSRQHAALFVRQQQQQQQQRQVAGLEAVLWDLGSAHGTFVQGKRISKVR